MLATRGSSQEQVEVLRGRRRRQVNLSHHRLPDLHHQSRVCWFRLHHVGGVVEDLEESGGWRFSTGVEVLLRERGGGGSPGEQRVQVLHRSRGWRFFREGEGSLQRVTGSREGEGSPESDGEQREWRFSREGEGSPESDGEQREWRFSREGEGSPESDGEQRGWRFSREGGGSLQRVTGSRESGGSPERVKVLQRGRRF
ncbi:hypothetical protein NHX12_021861 [Muraenolepis orangiensis]|uniref:Uncharacterized protein n=1 Tax=Muraenolepis orangiensis TaxID=630683 RepID=A0A9Q0IVY5_9TELE|nr:hypothetical protein NHX12_021861 [Muraenolepis orangiensis]